MLRHEVPNDLKKLGHFKISPKLLELKTSAQLAKQTERLDSWAGKLQNVSSETFYRKTNFT